MKPYKTILLSLLILPLPLLLGSCEKEEEIENTRWVLVWSDEFDTPTPDNRPDPSKALQDTVIRNFRTIPTE